MRRGEVSPVGVCPVCARVTKLLVGGAIRVHGWKANEPGNCPGSYAQPVTVPAEAPRRRTPEPTGGDWTEQAACVAYDPEMWFEKDTRPAKEICATCTVRSQCLEWVLALDTDPDGVWGGYDPAERRLLARRRANVA
jgi:WhiB family transcriptional regulator, redox-sensing transcriptional regulator